ncbi:flagellar motor switch protein FliN [Spongiibacter sp. KMU-158]|uniref:Flagellar motor switch protein FliN n=1 Tax=Spongiibacter pelagi TaxID=2760804 RepID=A0A927GVI7_9GAMM|nr:flagellar motor switch protein FliN [Spongiibacter pelagi]MBD2858440.1 flagellar motor switch protein FliN [Spongiibacter pelagi]
MSDQEQQNHEQATEQSPEIPDSKVSEQQTKMAQAAIKQGLNKMTGNMNLDKIMDVNVNVSVEVGRARMSIRELRELNQGAIIELDRAAGTPLDVLVNGTLVARGEIVVVKEKFGIMLTEVVNDAERED